MFEIEIPEASQEALEAVTKRKDALRSIQKRKTELAKERDKAIRNRRPLRPTQMDYEYISQQMQKRLNEMKGD